MQKLFYVRIDIVDLMDFATDPEGENMSLLTFAKELKKEKSAYPQIQRMINEAHCYIRQKKEAGKKSAEKRKKAKENFNDVVTTLEQRSNDVGTQVNAPPTNNNNRNNNRLPTNPTKVETNIEKRRVFITEEGTQVDADTGECLTPFDEGYLS